MKPKVARLKIREAAAELNVCPRTIHNHIRKYADMVELTRNDSLPSSPTNGLRGVPINISRSGRITWRVDLRDINDYIANATRETLNLPLYNWRCKS